MDNLHKALFWKKLKGNTVQCVLCPRNCVIKENSRGNCGVRENQKGKLYSLVYGRASSYNVDPIEKKPLYHFLPGEKTFSFATVGCNLHCMFCQNWEISQCRPEESEPLVLMPEDIVEMSKKMRLKIISFTYTEPTIYWEYMHDTAKLAEKNGMKNVVVSNGFTNSEPLKKILPRIDAANIDLKGDKKFYEKVTGAWIEPVLESLKIYKKKGVWLEITNLLIPGLNDSEKQIIWLVGWIEKNLGKDVPLHFSAFWPTYKLQNIPPTSIKTLRKAREIGMKKLNYVYTGNLPDDEGNATYCPKCNKALIRRKGFEVVENNLKNGKCPCGEKIPGVWK